MSEPRYDSFFAEAEAELKRYPGKQRFSLSRKLLQGLVDEMAWAGTIIVDLESKVSAEKLDEVIKDNRG